ncbi:MAG: polysaccharide lyase [Cyanobacteria bacterium P01_H01_bin.15]
MRIRSTARALILSGATFLCTLTSSVIAQQIGFKSSFENALEGWRRELCCDYSAELVNYPVREGTQSLKITLNRTDPDIHNSKRAELKLSPVPADSEYEYSFSIFLPHDYAHDQEREIVAQWHSSPDFSLGETRPGQPPLALHTENGSWRLHRAWDEKPVTLRKQPQGKQAINLGRYDTGQWTDWRVRVRWSHDSRGYIYIWKNKNLVWQHQGPSTYNDQLGPKFKIGIYKPGWKSRPQRSRVNQRVLYIDRIEAVLQAP